MKFLVTSFIVVLLCTGGMIPTPVRAQNASLIFELLYGGPDSVRIKARMTTPTGVSFRMQAVFVCATYDSIKFRIDSMYTIMNHRFASVGWLSDSVPWFDTNNGSRGFALSIYGEEDPSPTINGIQIPQNYDQQLCTFTFYPRSSSPGTATFDIYGNQSTAAYSGYYITTQTQNQPFVFTPIQINYPVELSSLSAAQQGKAIVVQWTTASESNNYGFYVERRSHENQDEWQTLDFVKGHGDSHRDITYLFLDQTLPADGAYEYRLRQLDYDGTTTYSRSVTAVFRSDIPDFTLFPNYPNPVSLSGNAGTAIQYVIPERSGVELTISDILGRTVAVLEADITDPGVFTRTWLPDAIPTGIYYAALYAKSVQSGNIRRASIPINVIR